MPDTTPVFGWPVPVLTDDPNGPAQITALADAIENTVNITTTVGVPGSPVTLNPTAWTDLCSVSITLPVAQSVEIVGWARMVNTGSGRPNVALQVVDGSTHLFGISEEHIGGTSDTFGEEKNIMTPRRRIGLSAGSHTIKLQGYKDANGVVTCGINETLASQVINTTGLEVSY